MIQIRSVSAETRPAYMMIWWGLSEDEVSKTHRKRETGRDCLIDVKRTITVFLAEWNEMIDVVMIDLSLMLKLQRRVFCFCCTKPRTLIPNTPDWCLTFFQWWCVCSGMFLLNRCQNRVLRVSDWWINRQMDLLGHADEELSKYLI